MRFYRELSDFFFKKNYGYLNQIRSIGRDLNFRPIKSEFDTYRFNLITQTLEIPIKAQVNL